MSVHFFLSGKCISLILLGSVRFVSQKPVVCWWAGWGASGSYSLVPGLLGLIYRVDDLHTHSRELVYPVPFFEDVVTQQQALCLLCVGNGQEELAEAVIASPHPLALGWKHGLHRLLELESTLRIL